MSLFTRFKSKPPSKIRLDVFDRHANEDWCPHGDVTLYAGDVFKWTSKFDLAGSKASEEVSIEVARMTYEADGRLTCRFINADALVVDVLEAMVRQYRASLKAAQPADPPLAQAP